MINSFINSTIKTIKDDLDQVVTTDSNQAKIKISKLKKIEKIYDKKEIKD
jgi:hypothetical protein